jgi:hypothetical protein
VGFEPMHAIDRRKIVLRKNVFSRQLSFRGYGKFRPSTRPVAPWEFLTGGFTVMAFE